MQPVEEVQAMFVCLCRHCLIQTAMVLQIFSIQTVMALNLLAKLSV